MVAYTRILNLFWLLDFFSQNISANFPPPRTQRHQKWTTAFFFSPNFMVKYSVFSMLINNLLRIFAIPSEFWIVREHYTETNTSFFKNKTQICLNPSSSLGAKNMLDCGAGDILFQQFINGETPNWFSSRSVKSFTQRTANWGHNAAAPGVSMPENKPSLSFIIIFYPLSRQTTHLSKSYADAFRFSSLALIALVGMDHFEQTPNNLLILY